MSHELRTPIAAIVSARGKPWNRGSGHGRVWLACEGWCSSQDLVAAPKRRGHKHFPCPVVLTDLFTASLQPAQKPLSGRQFPADAGLRPYRSAPIRTAVIPPAGPRPKPARPAARRSRPPRPARDFDSVRNGCCQRCRRDGHVPCGLAYKAA